MKTIDEPKEIKTRLNDYVTVTHEVTEEGKEWRDLEKEYRANAVYQVYVEANIGDSWVSYAIAGELLIPLEDWIILDVHVNIGRLTKKQSADEEDFVLYHDFEDLSIPLKAEGNESLRTWIKQFRERAGV